MSAKIRSARASRLVLSSLSATWVAACSLLAPTESELSGGPANRGDLRGSSAGEDTSGAGSESGGHTGGAAGGEEPGGAGGSVSTSGSAVGGGNNAGSGNTAGGGTSAGGGTGGGTSAGSGNTAGGGTGSSTCVADVTSQVPKASSLSDDFADGAASPNFRVDGDPETCAREADGRVVVALPAPTPAGYFCYYETLDEYDLTCDSVVVKVVEPAGPKLGVQTYLYVGPNPANRIMVLVENGSYQFSTDAVDFKSAGRYDPSAPWWRLREAPVDGKRTVIFETSSDAVTWTQRISAPRPFPLDNVKVMFGAGAYQSTSSAGAARFACYNAPPGCE